MKFNIFDNFFDPVFVIDEERNVVYGNESASTMCDVSSKRISKDKRIYDLVTFSDDKLFSMPEGKLSELLEGHFVELESTVIKNNKAGKYQVGFFKVSDECNQWLMVLRDVALEEKLQVKYKAQVGEKQTIINELVKAQLELKGYSKNLEKMVEARTAEVNRANKMLSAIMNSLGQGFLVFDKEGLCGDIYTKACETILETQPKGKKITDVLKLDEAKASEFSSWAKAMFEELLPFESLLELGLKQFDHSEGKQIKLEYFPIRNSDNLIEYMVLVATDNTSEHLANLALEKEKQYTQLILRVVKNKNQFLNFLSSTQLKIDNLLTETSDIEKNSKNAFRMLHTIEGEAGLFGAMSISMIARKAQEIIEPIKSSNRSESIKDISKSYTDEIKGLNLCFADFKESNQELFTRLGLYGDKKIEIEEAEIRKFLDLIKVNGDKTLLKEFQSRFLKKTVEDMLSHYNELIYNMSKQLNKEVSAIDFRGGGVLVLEDKFIKLFETFVHIFKNTMDHGMLSPEEREGRGKERAGLVWIECEKVIKGKLEFLVINVKDDGEGIDPEKIKNKLNSNFPDLDTSEMNSEEIIQKIFLPGFSSRDIVSKFSGRGVGLDAVKTEVDNLSGEIRVDSVIGLGTTFEIIIPLNGVDEKKQAA